VWRCAASPSWQINFANRQYGNEHVMAVGRYLDATLEAVLRNAAD
jgi:hypothetical protein